jgi:site-specific DNA-methyltransferase (adenine-specific)
MLLIYIAKDYGGYDWNNEIPSAEMFQEMLRTSKDQIIWGGNYFVESLTNSMCWLIWDKDNGKTDYADCELAWTSFDSAARKFKWRWQGMLQENMGKYKEKREHPTQKPLELMRWCLENYAKDSQLIIDPFGGSGTTARACKDMGKDFIIIDKEEKYCSIMEKRLEQEVLF